MDKNQVKVFLDHFDLTNVVGSALIVAVAAFLIFYINRVLNRLLLKAQVRLRMSYETALTLARVIVIALWLGTGLLLLSFWGVSVSGLWTVLLSVTTVIGVGFLAVWTMISNITASFFITVWRPFSMGATVEILPENFKGRVVDRNMMFTVLRENQGAVLYIPNNLFFQKAFRVTEQNQRHLFEALESEFEQTAQKERPEGSEIPPADPLTSSAG